MKALSRDKRSECTGKQRPSWPGLDVLTAGVELLDLDVVSKHASCAKGPYV